MLWMFVFLMCSRSMTNSWKPQRSKIKVWGCLFTSLSADVWHNAASSPADWALSLSLPLQNQAWALHGTARVRLYLQKSWRETASELKQIQALFVPQCPCCITWERAVFVIPEPAKRRPQSGVSGFAVLHACVQKNTLLSNYRAPAWHTITVSCSSQGNAGTRKPLNHIIIWIT